MAVSLPTPIGVLSFPNLFSPRPRAPGGEPVYQCSILFDQNAQRDPAYQALRKAVVECIDEHNGSGKSRVNGALPTCPVARALGEAPETCTAIGVLWRERFEERRARRAWTGRSAPPSVGSSTLCASSR